MKPRTPQRRAPHVPTEAPHEVVPGAPEREGRAAEDGTAACDEAATRSDGGAAANDPNLLRSPRARASRGKPPPLVDLPPRPKR